MSKDEKVNGPRIAARILEKMEPENRHRVSQLIQAREPALFSAMEESLLSIEALCEFSLQKREKVIQRVDHNDLVTCLKESDEAVRTSLLEAASAKRREIIEYDLQSTPAVAPEAAKTAKARVLETIREIDELPDAPMSNPKDLWA